MVNSTAICGGPTASVVFMFRELSRVGKFIAVLKALGLNIERIAEVFCALSH